MKFGHIELFVRDPMASLRFYEAVLGCKVVAVQAGGTFVWIALGNVEILLRRGSPHGAAMYREAPSAIVIYTDDLESQCRILEARGLIFAGNDGSSREPTFTDPDGHWFQLVDPGDFK